MNHSYAAAFGLLLSVVMLWLPANTWAQQEPAWTDAECHALYKKLMNMMHKASDPKTSDPQALKKAIDDSLSSFAKHCPKEAPSLKYLARSAEDIEADRQETAGADATTDKAGKKMEENKKHNGDAGYTNCENTLELASAVPASADKKPSAQRAAKNEAVDKFLNGCLTRGAKATDCDTLRKAAIDILKEDVLRLGSTANPAYLPNIIRMFYSDDVELRITAAHAMGMIGPQDSDVGRLAGLSNDPVPDVRHAVSNMLSQGKGNAITLLKQRIVHLHTGREVEKPADPAKFSMPVAPDSVYLFDSSDAGKGRLSYVVCKGDAVSFFKGKVKKGPFKWEQFKEQYRYQIQDEDEALNQAQQAAGKQLENEQPPDPAKNMEAYVAYMQKLGSVSTQGSMGKMLFDTYQPNLYGAPNVFVLEERQIGQRSYPTRYVVVYQELAFKRPGYRLAWTTVPDDALKAAQVASLKEQKEEEALKATTKKEEEAAKKREAELESLTKKKDAAEKKQFKKGQADLEKELGF
ncbi:MAG TPA: hypothetical protein VKB33_10070 [Nitrospira sp.]|nr:hypothetical protein [Nitrospira sp.]